MFSRTAKSIVRSLGSRQFHIGERNLKIALIDGVGEISQTLSQLLRHSAKLDVLALYDVAAISKPLSNYDRIYNHCDDRGFRPITEKLVEALYRLPTAEEASTLNSPLMSSEIISKAGSACSRMRPYARILGEMGPSSMRIWQRNCANAAIRKWFPDLVYPPFQQRDINPISEARITGQRRTIERKRTSLNSYWSDVVAREDDHRSLSTSLLNDIEKLARGSTRKFRNIEVLPEASACGTALRSINCVIPAALKDNKSILLREVYRNGRRYIWFPIKTLLGVTNDSINFVNDCFRKHGNVTGDRSVKIKLEDEKSLVDNADYNRRGNNSSREFQSSESSKRNELKLNTTGLSIFANATKEGLKSLISVLCRNNVDDLETRNKIGNKDLRTDEMANEISRQSSSLNLVNRKCEDNNGVVAVNRDNKIITHDIVKQKNWVERASCKIKFILSDLHAKVRSRSTATSDSYRLEDILAINLAVPVHDTLFGRAILFASRDCDSKSGIRNKIEELCAQRRKFLRRKAEKDDICKKRKRSCKTAERGDEEREKICLRRRADCTGRKKRTCQEGKKVSCKRRRRSSCGKEDERDCRKTRKEEPQKKSCKQREDDDTCGTKKDPCKKPRTPTCKRQDSKKDQCKESKEDEYRKSRCRKRDESVKRKECRKDVDKVASCKQREARRGCEKKRETIRGKETKEESGKSCSEIKKIEPCEKKECPTVTKAPGCSEGEKKDEKGKSCRK